MISSRQNAIVKQAIALREGKVRRKQGLFLIDTPRDILRAIESARIEVVDIFVCADFPIPEELRRGVKKSQVRITEFSQSAFEAMAYRQNPNGVLAIAKTWDTHLTQLAFTMGELKTVLVAEKVEKPGNLGALLRIADAVGAQALISCDEVVDLFNPNALRASAGAAFSVPYASGSMDSVVGFVKDHGLTLVGTSPDAKKDLWQADLSGPVAIAAGSEAFGLSDKFMKACDQLISLPMLGSGDSLNVSAATAVTLYEVLRQRQK